MVNQGIVAGLRNAIDRGQNIEKAVQSFILAGYDEKEVREAESYLQQEKLRQEKAILKVPEYRKSKRDKERLKEVKRQDKEIREGANIFLIILLILFIIIFIGAVIILILKFLKPDLFQLIMDNLSKLKFW